MVCTTISSRDHFLLIKIPAHFGETFKASAISCGADSFLHAQQHSTPNAVFEWAGVSQRFAEIFEDETGASWPTLLLGRKEGVSHSNDSSMHTTQTEPDQGNLKKQNRCDHKNVRSYCVPRGGWDSGWLLTICSNNPITPHV